MKNIYIVKLNLNGKTYYKVGQTGSEKIANRFKSFKKYDYEIARFWMHRTVRFDSYFKKYYTADIEYSRYAQIMNSAFMMFKELKK